MKNHPCVLLLVALVATLFSSPATFAQKKPSGQFEGLVEVTEVFLDVVATDKKGRLIPGLGKDDFIVIEDGKPVEITSVSYYTTRYGNDPAKAAALKTAGVSADTAAPEVPASRYFILFFHDQTRNATPFNKLLQQQMNASRKAHDWVRDSLTGSDWVAVVSYDVKLKIHQDFTQDVGSLLAAIGDAATSKDPGVMKPSVRARLTAGTKPSLLRGLPDGVDIPKETKRIYDAIRLLANASHPIVGRKNMMLFTIGFGDINTGVGFGATPDPRHYPPMEQALNHSNVAVYPIDLTPVEITHSQSDFLSRLALDTGGYYFQNIVNFKGPLERIGLENSAYYLLSFRTEHPSGESGYRQIKVKSKNKKIRMRTRRGYKYGIGE